MIYWHILTTDNKSASRPSVLCGSTDSSVVGNTTREAWIGDKGTRLVICPACEALMGTQATLEQVMDVVITEQEQALAQPAKKKRVRKKKDEPS